MTFRFTDLLKRRSNLLPLAALPLLGGCMETEYNPVVLHDYPTANEAVCLPETTSSFRANPVLPVEAGTAVEIAGWGTTGNLDSHKTTAAGAPWDGAGSVLVHAADTSIGEIDLSTLARITPPPAALNAGRFGEALLAADVRDGMHTGVSYLGYGEELLVGAPGQTAEVAAGRGVLLSYVVEYDSTDMPDGEWTLDAMYQPTGLPLNAEFGAAIAANYDGGPGDLPEWIAVGAPGIDRVYILEVDPDPASSNRFSYLQQLRVRPSLLGSGFGSALSVADFDGDGYLDLAVGAPYDMGGGRVFVYSGDPGDCGGSFPALCNNPIELASGFGGGSDEFGASLAAGHFFGAMVERVGLVVGSPGEDVDASEGGAICQFRFEDDADTVRMYTAHHRCDENPDPMADARFGEAVAVGDFVPLDSNGSFSGDYADVEEIAVGIPGQDAGAVRAGVVSILVPGEDGADLARRPTPLTELYRYHGDQTDALFGSALATNFVQDTPFEDLIIGAPGAGIATATGHGSISVTRSVLQSGTFPCHHLSGEWISTDVAGDEIRARAFWADDELSFELLTNVTIEVRDDDGNFCEYVDGDDETDDDFYGTSYGWMELPSTEWVCGDTEATFNIDLGAVGNLDGTLTYDSVAETFELYLDDTGAIFTGLNLLNWTTGCHIVDNPFVFTKDVDFGCE